MSFLRHLGDLSPINKMQREQQHKLSLPHSSSDESPVGYSWRVALQQSPLPLHQPRSIVQRRSVKINVRFSVWIVSLNLVVSKKGFIPGVFLLRSHYFDLGSI